MFIDHINQLVLTAKTESNSWILQSDCLGNPQNDPVDDDTSTSYHACLSELRIIVEKFEEKTFDEVAFQKLLGLKHLTRRIKPHNASCAWEMLTNGIEFMDDI